MAAGSAVLMHAGPVAFGEERLWSRGGDGEVAFGFADDLGGE